MNNEYNEALCRAKELHDAGNALTKKQMEIVFPQLAESEDERIRKALIEGVSQIRCKGDITREQMLAYLEKQKEQKPDFIVPKRIHPKFAVGDTVCRPMWSDHTIREIYIDCNDPVYICVNDEGLESHISFSEQDEWKRKEQKPVQTDDEKEYVRTLKSLISDFLRGKEDVDREYYQQIFDWLDGRHIEQKPAEWSKDYREEDLRTRFAFYTYKDEDGVLYLSNVFVEETSRNHGFGTRILRAAEKVAETIGATTISLKVKQDSPANAWYRKNGYGYVAFEDGYDWLEKNLEYMKPNKQEWSEEDEAMRNNIIRVLSAFVGTVECESNPSLSSSYPTYRREIDWLKSLRPQSHWKPSEEQMKAFKGYIEDFQKRAEAAVGGWNNFDVMIRLYEQLKKL